MGLFGWLKGGSGREEDKAPAVAEVADDPSRRGIELVAAGRYAEACEAFRRAIASEPKIAAHHVNLAFALQESGEAVAAVGHLKQAAALDATSFDAHYMLGGALEQSRDLAGAANALRQAVDLQPDMEQAHADLVRVLATDDKNDQACAVADTALSRFPTSANLHVARGNLHMAAGETDAALASFDRALAGRPDDINVRLNRALALRAAQRLDEAQQAYTSILADHPLAAEAYVALARFLQSRGEAANAALAYGRALEIRPQEVEWLNLLGATLHGLGDTEKAIACYREAIRLRPDLPSGYTNYGLALADRGDIPAAIVEYRKSLAVQPIAETYDNLAIAVQKLGRIDEAIELYGEAVKLQPGNLDTRCNLAAALADAGNPGAAIEEYRRILALDDQHVTAHSNLLFSLSVYEATPIGTYLDEARRYGVKVSQPGGPFLRLRPRSAGEPLRIGFVSGDLREHPVGFFLEGILASLDPRRFELFAYPTVAREDALTARIRPLFKGWRSLLGLSTDQAAAAIRSDGVDILLDLAGHTAQNRLPVFAARAAPVQVAWLGYFASTGVAAMDYVLADDVCVPLGADDQFTEKVWRLPQTRLCFTPPATGTAAGVAAPPVLERGHVTFGCFQRFPKITAPVLALWGDIFAALPSARLFLQSHQTGRRIYVDGMLARLKAVGIDESRVTARPPAPREHYLEAYSEVDIILDTFPFNGGTTTCEALWMGVPTVTLEGDSMISRQGMTMMKAAGLAGWVGESPADYVALAVAHASDPAKLSALRSSMREAVRQTPLFDVKLFAQRFSKALEAIWVAESRALVA